MTLSAVTAKVALEGDSRHAGLAAVGRVLLVAVPLFVGAYAASRGSSRRFGRALLALAFVSFLATLSESRDPVLYSIGRVSNWCLPLVLVYPILAFPGGRLTHRLDRRLIAASTVLVVALYLPTALLVRAYPVPGAYTSCSSGCPSNAFFVLHSQPSFVGGAVAARELLTILILTLVTLRLVWRVRSATRLMRYTLSPVLVSRSSI